MNPRKTVTYVVELLNFVQIAFGCMGVRRFVRA